jgi:hypothetical protein
MQLLRCNTEWATLAKGFDDQWQSSLAGCPV